MLTFLALASCQPLPQASTTKPDTVPEVGKRAIAEAEEPEPALVIPAGRAIVRECYGSPERVSARPKVQPAQGPTGGFGYGATGSGGAPSGTKGKAEAKPSKSVAAQTQPTTTAAPPAPAAAPMAEATPSAPDAVAGVDDLGAGEGDALAT
ncbi:MAG: hypothetical protein ACOZNI_10160, partial [Myxococcota bacterium]